MPITVYGNGHQTRSFCYVDDLIQAFLVFMEVSADFMGPVNLGNPSEFRIIELAEKVIALTESGSKVIHKPLPADDPIQRQPDIVLTRESLGWQPAVPLEQGLATTIAYFEDLLRTRTA